MISKNERIIILLIFCFIFLNCVKVKAEQSLIYVQVNLNERYIHYNEVISKYGAIWIGYTIAHDIITTDSGEERFIIDKAYYYYKKDGTYVLLGSVDKTGLYDKNGSCLKPASKIASGYLLVGISSALIDVNILGPRFILQSETNSNIWGEIESFVIVDIDTQQDTLRLMDMSRFLAP